MGTLDHRFKCKYKTIKHLGEKEEIYHITKILQQSLKKFHLKI